MAGRTAILAIKIIGDAADAQKALGETSAKAGGFASGLEKAAKPAGLALAALGAAGLSAANAAAEDQRGQALLANALKNSTGATSAQVAAVEKYISNTSKAAAVSDDELRPALGTLVRATGNTETAQNALTSALDISAATGKDLGAVSAAIAKGYAGNTTALGRLVPGLDKGVLASKDMNAIMGELARTTGGAASAAANTAAGRMEGMKIQFDEAKESLGAALVPALKTFANVLSGVAGFIQNNTGLFMGLAAVVGVVAGAIVALNFAMKAYRAAQMAIMVATQTWTAIQWLLNAAMSANPIGLIIIAIVAVIAIIVILIVKVQALRDFFIAVWNGIKDAAAAAWSGIVAGAQAVWSALKTAWNGILTAIRTVFNWVASNWPLILAIITGPIGIAVLLVVKYWSQIKAGAEAAWRGIQAAVQIVVDAIRGIIDRFARGLQVIWDSIKSAGSAIWDRIRSAAQTALDGARRPIDAIRSAFDAVVNAIKDVINWLGRIKIPDTLKKAGDVLGGIFGRSLPVVGAGLGGPGVRAVSGYASPLAARALVPTMSTAAVNRALGGVNITIEGALDPVAVARQVRVILRDDDRRRSGVRLVTA